MKINIKHIGSFAQQVLERSERALVSGIASRGIYIQPKSDWTLYISQENFRGPLTLNLEQGSFRLKKVRAGHLAQFSPGEIHFPEEDITVSLTDGNIWDAPGVDKENGAATINVDPILSLVHKITPENPYLPLLSRNPEQIPGVAVIGERILDLQNALVAGIPEKITEGSIKLLGLGPGLTPLGDDFLLGVILTLNRWKHVLPDQFRRGPVNLVTDIVDSLNEIILENTRLKTTRISASLLACAMERAADERLLVVLDGLFSDSPITQSDMRNLLRWGNSSGITALAGMISVLRTKDTLS